MSTLGNLFLPLHENDHRAGILKPQTLSLFTLIFVCARLFLNFYCLVNPKVLGYAANISPERIIELTNQKRAAAGLSLLKENGTLSEAARRKAGDMFAFNYWAHVSPSGRDPWTFFKEVGYRYLYAGENLARDFRDPGSVMEAWMNSPSHRENVVNGKYQEIGVAVVDGTLLGTETTLVVQLFGTQVGQTASKPVTKPPKLAVAPAEPEPVFKPAAQVPPLNLPTTVQVRSEETIAKSESDSVPAINPLSLSKVLAIFIIGIIFGAFLFDFILVSEEKTPRLSGRSFAHMLFLGFIILIVVLVKQGVIV